MYQDLNLKRSDHKKQYVLKPYNEIITLLAFSVEQRFVELVGSPSSRSLVAILYVNIWLKNQEQLSTYCYTEIETSAEFPSQLLMLTPLLSHIFLAQASSSFATGSFDFLCCRPHKYFSRPSFLPKTFL